MHIIVEKKQITDTMTKEDALLLNLLKVGPIQHFPGS